MLLFFVWLNLLFSAQDNILINQTHDFFEVDHLGNIYLVQDSELLMFDSKGNKLHTYSNSLLGTISSVDISDPLRILVFYRDFNQILFLDRKLAEIGGEIDLYDVSENDTDLVCSSQSGGFWMYNSSDNQTIHISANGEKINQSILLNSFFGESIPTQMIEYGNDLFLLFAEKGILKLDRNGQFLKKIQIPGINSFQVSLNGIRYTKNDNNLYQFLPNAKSDMILFTKPDSRNERLKINNNSVFISNGKSIMTTTFRN